MPEPDFRPVTFAGAEATVRAYDTKSEIGLAGLAFSFSPIFVVIQKADSSPYVNTRIGIVFCLFVVVTLLFLRVLSPVLLKSRQGQSDQDVFFLDNVDQYDASTYREVLQKTDLTVSYEEQILKLHAVRDTKHIRLQVAALALIVYALLVMLYGIFLFLSVVYRHF
jgi:hypothetical protein